MAPWAPHGAKGALYGIFPPTGRHYAWAISATFRKGPGTLGANFGVIFGIFGISGPMAPWAPRAPCALRPHPLPANRSGLLLQVLPYPGHLPAPQCARFLAFFPFLGVWRQRRYRAATPRSVFNSGIIILEFLLPPSSIHPFYGLSSIPGPFSRSTHLAPFCF